MIIPATLVRITVKWLDGGKEDEVHVLTPYAVRLDHPAAGVSTGGGRWPHAATDLALRSGRPAPTTQPRTLP